MMSKVRDKGFSIIEIIIAVAVMTVLISPIIAQVFQTVQTSARAKQEQYVIDNADLVLEYFRSNSVKDLAVTGDKNDAVTVNSVNEYTNVDCDVYIGGSYFDTVQYNVTDYELAQVQLGREKNHYTRVVSMDDLTNKLGAEGYEARYDIDSTTTGVGDLSTWEITSDHSAVKYDGDGHVCAIMAQSRAGAYSDPNTTTLGNIQDINSKTMAIIEGNPTTLDNRFQSDFIGNLVNIIARHKNELIANGTYDYYKDQEELNNVFDAIRQSSSSNFSRMIKLSVTGEDVVGTEPSYYKVVCDVYYKAQYTFLGESFGSTDEDNKPFRYTVFSQNFYTSEPPDVFFVYEPFILQSDASYTTYANNEYFLVKSDNYTGGNTGLDPSKIYLIKSNSTWANALGVNTGTTVDNDNFFLTRRGTFYPVKIHVNKIRNSSDSTVKPLQIITNISYKPDETEEDKIFNDETSGSRQFVTDQITSADVDAPDMGLAPDEVCVAYPGAGGGGNEIGDITFADGNKKAITYPLDDKRTEGRLFSITVRYNNVDRPTDAEKYFTGAKGAD